MTNDPHSEKSPTPIVKSPKDKHSALVHRQLDEGLAVKSCPTTGGMWISKDDYQAWLAQQPQPLPNPSTAPKRLDQIEFEPSPEDLKASLCPECSHYLTRAKVNTKNSFFVERCVKCGGIWCDRGEWEVLQALGLHTQIEALFSGEWQAAIRERLQSDRQRQATIDKLGLDLATRLFELAKALKAHPNGDFGVAYLMQQFGKSE